jgi:hypothetical protein
MNAPPRSVPLWARDHSSASKCAAKAGGGNMNSLRRRLDEKRGNDDDIEENESGYHPGYRNKTPVRARFHRNNKATTNSYDACGGAKLLLLVPIVATWLHLGGCPVTCHCGEEAVARIVPFDKFFHPPGARRLFEDVSLRCLQTRGVCVCVCALSLSQSLAHSLSLSLLWPVCLPRARTFWTGGGTLPLDPWGPFFLAASSVIPKKCVHASSTR